MKKLVSLLMLAIPFMGICQQKYKITGVISGVPSKAKMYLVYDQGNTFVKDSCRLTAGTFKFSGLFKGPKSAILVLSRTGKYADTGVLDMQSVYLEATPVRVIGSDSVAKAKITGGTLNAQNQEKLRLIKNIKGSVYQQEPKLVTAFVARYPTSKVSLDWLMSFSPKNQWVADSYAKLSPSLKQSTAAKAFGLEIQHFLSVFPGKVAPDFSLSDSKGKIRKLSDFKGKYVLLDFWASYCKPCRAANPGLKALYDALKSTGKFEIVGISADRSKAPWLKAIEEDQLSWTQLIDLPNEGTTKATDLYSVSILPTHYLIGPDGKILSLDVLAKIKKDKVLPAEEKAGVMGRLSDLVETNILTALKKEQLSEVGFKEDFNDVDNQLNTDIGESALSNELGMLKFPEDSLAINRLINTRGTPMYKQKQKMKKAFIASHPNSFLSLYLLNEMEIMYSTESYAAAFNALSDQLKATSIAEKIKARLEKGNATPVGTLAVDFKRIDQFGKTVKLSDYKGKLVILDFWGTWCIPCRLTHPHLKELYSRYKAKGLEIVAVANEKTKDPEKARVGWLGAIKKDDVNWVQVLNKEGEDNQDIVKDYAITSYPTKLLLDQNGKILMRVIGGMNDEMDILIKSILDK